MPQLFVYAESSKGLERTFLIDAYMRKSNGEVELYRNGMSEPLFILSADDIANHFIVMEWGADLSEHYGEEDFEFDLEEDEDGFVSLNVTLPTVH